MLWASALAAACGLPAIEVPPDDAAVDGTTGAETGPEGSADGPAGQEAAGEAGVDSTTMEAGADAADAAGDSQADAGDATVAETGATESGVPDGPIVPPGEAGPDQAAPDAGGCDGSCVAYVLSDVVGDAGLVTLVTTNPLATVGTIPVGHDPLRLAFTPDGSKAYVSEAGDGTVTVIDTSTRQVTKTIAVTTPAGSLVRGIAVSPDGAFAFVSNTAQQVVAQIDTSTDTLTATTLSISPSGPYGLAFSPDGGELWAGGTSDNGVSRYSYPALSSLGTTAGVSGGHMLGDRIVFLPDFSAAFLNSGSGCPCCGEFDMVTPGAATATYRNHGPPAATGW